MPPPEGIDPAEIASQDNWLSTSSQLFEEPDLQRWLLDQDQAKPYVEQMTQAQDSPLVLNKYQQQDRAQGIIDTVLAELFSGDSARTYARRLEETAFHLAARSRFDSAKRALAVALALQKGGGKGIPFCEDLVRQSIAVHYHEEHPQEQEPGRRARLADHETGRVCRSHAGRAAPATADVVISPVNRVAGRW